MRAVDPMLNILAADLRVSVQDVALLASAFTLPYAAMQLVFGPLGDAVGKVRLIRLNLLLLCVGLIASALATDHSTLMAARIFAGSFAGGIIPVTLAAVGDRVPFSGRPLALSRLLLAVVCGQLMGSTASGFIAEWVGWREVFWTGAVVAALATFAVFFGIKEGRSSEGLSVRSAAARYSIVFRNPLSLKVYIVVAFEGGLIFGAFPMVAPLMVSHAIGDAVEAGVVLAAFAMGGAFYAFAVQFLVRTLGLSRMAGVGAVLVGLLLAAAAIAPTLLGVGLLFGAAGFTFYMIHNPLQIMATELAPEARGSALALFATSFFVGQAIGAAALSAVEMWIGPEWVFILAGCGMMLLAYPASRLLPR